MTWASTALCFLVMQVVADGAITQERLLSGVSYGLEVGVQTRWMGESTTNKLLKTERTTMYQAVVLNHTVIDVEDFVDELNDHHVVVLNSIMDERASQLREQAEAMMKNWRGEGPSVYYYQPRIFIEGDPWWIPAFMHSTKHQLNLCATTRLVQRAVEMWRSRGSAERFLYTNNVTRGAVRL